MFFPFTERVDDRVAHLFIRICGIRSDIVVGNLQKFSKISINSMTLKINKSFNFTELCRHLIF